MKVFMARKVGGISEHQGMETFAALPADISVKEQMDLMSRCYFSISASRTEPIEHQFSYAGSKTTETVRITGSPEYGIATIHDQDLLIFVISQWVEAKKLGLVATRRIAFTPYQLFSWMGREPTGSAYQRLRDALHRLKTTNIETTMDYEEGQRRHRKKVFSWISEWEMTEENGRIKGIEVVLAEWLFESVYNFNVLTLDKRYFAINGGLERWLYLYARKATGGGVWKESLRSLHRKSAGQQAFKHYASTVRKVAKKNELPGLRLETQLSAKGEQILLMERTERPSAIDREVAQQPALIETTPLEEAWQNVLESMRRSSGKSEVKAWLENLRLLAFENGVLSFRPQNTFIGETVLSRYKHRLLPAWKALGYEVSELRMEKPFGIHQSKTNVPPRGEVAGKRGSLLESENRAG
jgi:plasmid replication initiation protein